MERETQAPGVDGEGRGAVKKRNCFGRENESGPGSLRVQAVTDTSGRNI